MSKVEIINDTHSVFGTEIYVDGVKVEGVSEYHLSQKAGCIAELNLVIPVTGMYINTPYKTTIEED